MGIEREKRQTRLDKFQNAENSPVLMPADLAQAVAPDGFLHRRSLSLNSSSVFKSTIRVGPFNLSITKDKKGVVFDGQGIIFFSASPGRPLVVSFRGKECITNRALSQANVQMEAGRIAKKVVHAVFYREDRMPIARVTASKSRTGIKVDLIAPFGSWMRGDNEVELIEENHR